MNAVAILLVDPHQDLMQVGTVPLHQILSMDGRQDVWFQSYLSQCVLCNDTADLKDV